MKENRTYIIGVDLGGTYVRLGVVSGDGRVFMEQFFFTPPSYEELLRTLILRCRHYVNFYPVLGVGIGVAGQVCADRKRLLLAPNLGWKDVAMAEDLESAIRLPVLLENDVRAIAFGEWLYGSGRGYTDLLCLVVGTGVGAGIIQNCRLVKGYTHTYGEVGHMCLELGGMSCRCGAEGCVETFLGGWGLVKRAQHEGLFVTSAQEVCSLYHSSDPTAKILIEKFREALVATTVSLVNGFNPGRLLLGGGVLRGLPEAISWVQQQTPVRVLPAAAKQLSIAGTNLGAFAGVVGAAALCGKKIDGLGVD